MKKIWLCLPLFSALTLASCIPGEPPRYVIVNETQEDIVAATFSDKAGVFAATKADAAQFGYSQVLVTGGRKGSGHAVTVQWLGSTGRARWHQATVEVDNARNSVKVAVWPGLRVCLREEGKGRPDLPDRCAKAVAVPALDPGAAGRLEHRTVVKDPPFFAEHRGSGQTRHVLEEKGDAVELFGKDEFLAAYPVGKQAAWLVDAWIGGEKGMFAVTGASGRGWTSLYLGPVEKMEGILPKPRLMLGGAQGYRFVVDTGNADIFLLPGVATRDYTILGQSPDGKQLAVTVPEQPGHAHLARGPVYHLHALDLEGGIIVRMNRFALPDLPKQADSEAFHGAWYREHCRWTPELSCA